MTLESENHTPIPEKHINRRNLLKSLGLMGAVVATATTGGKIAAAVTGEEDNAYSDNLKSYFQEHYQKMTAVEIQETIARLERQAKRKWGVDLQIENTQAQPGVLFGYALNISKCKGYRKCVTACVKENNQSRDPEIQYIKVFEISNGTINFAEADPYYDHATVPKEGKSYLPVQCQHCENPPCVKVCPTKATWKEPDGIVVVDYDWCIGCRYCQAACPYGARHFNWAAPTIPQDKINTKAHYLSNRPRDVGVMEKCTFCLHRTRKGQQPACEEACPTGARVFGNLLDPNGELRYILENKVVFRLKEELGTEPKFWYYMD